MRTLISGSSGLVGSALGPFLQQKGLDVHRLVRRAPKKGEIQWNPDGGLLETSALEGFDAIINLSGESIASGRWSDDKKRRIRDSRVKSTRLLAEKISQAAVPPKIFLCASAVGYYGNRGGELLREDSASGNDYLAEVCREWEAAAALPTGDKTRVAHLRFGVILSGEGGALAKMLTPFKLGVGGNIGSGEQYMSWIALDDVLGVIHHALLYPLKGPVNVVAPDAVTNSEFTKTLGRVLSRPTVLPMPAFAARFAFGEMADALLLTSQRVEPQALHRSGYAFQYPSLEPALRHILQSRKN